MRLLFNIGHPAQVHLFKNLIWKLEENGHVCKITTIDKDVSINLLKAYNFDYEVVGSEKPSLLSKAIELINIEYKLYKISRHFKPDILIGGVGNAYVAHVGKFVGKPSIVFDDTEHAKISHFITDPFANKICTPSCFKNDLGKKHIRYDGYHELAYLHPNYFTPNPAVLNEIGLTEDDTFIILRFVSWDADHDIGHSGIQNKIELVQELEKYGQVLITSERKLGDGLEKYQIKVSPDKLHDLLYYASLYVGDGGTTASECAVLGTPAVFISTIACGYQYDEEKYGLLYLFSNPIYGERDGLSKATELLQNDNLKQKSLEKRNLLLKDKIDVTSFMVNFIENFYFKGTNYE